MSQERSFVTELGNNPAPGPGHVPSLAHRQAARRSLGRMVVSAGCGLSSTHGVWCRALGEAQELLLLLPYQSVAHYDWQARVLHVPLASETLHCLHNDSRSLENERADAIHTAPGKERPEPSNTRRDPCRGGADRIPPTG